MGYSSQQRGFTLVELVITIVVVAIMMMGIAGFIQLGAKGYSDTVQRQHLQNQARFVVEKLTREIRHAVPNSFSVTQDATDGQCLHFMPIRYVGFYQQLPSQTSDEFEFITVSNDDSITVNNLAGLRLVLNPNSPDDLRSVSQSQSLNNASLAGSIAKVVLDNVFASGSVAKRVYLFDQNGWVNYCLIDSRILRNDIQVASELDSNNSEFAIDESSLTRSGLVHFKFTFRKQDEVSVYNQDVQVLNVP